MHAAVRIARKEAAGASVVVRINMVSGAESHGGVHHDVGLVVMVPVDCNPFLRACCASQVVGRACVRLPERSCILCNADLCLQEVFQLLPDEMKTPDAGVNGIEIESTQVGALQGEIPVGKTVPGEGPGRDFEAVVQQLVLKATRGEVEAVMMSNRLTLLDWTLDRLPSRVVANLVFGHEVLDGLISEVLPLFTVLGSVLPVQRKTFELEFPASRSARGRAFPSRSVLAVEASGKHVQIATK